MRLHHVGYACTDIASTITQLQETYDITAISPIIYDELQDAQLCMLELADHSRIELVAGKVVESILQQQISLYHVCYETADLAGAINQFRQAGHLPLSSPKPAKLFGGRNVVFIQTSLGLIELLEAELVQNALPVVINGTFNLEPLLPLLKHANDMLALNVNFTLTAYNQVFQELLDPESAMRCNTSGANLLFLNCGDWFHYQENEADDNFQAYVKDLINSMLTAASSIRLWLILCPAGNELTEKQQQLVEQATIQIKSAVTQQQNIYWLDSCNNLSAYAINEIHDAVTNRIGHIPYSEEFYAALAICSINQLVSDLSQPFKMVVVDCDNTLWHGVVGEVGTQHIKLTPAHLLLQQKLIDLFHAGVVICLSSKNNVNDVMAVFEQRPDMLLQLNHLVSWQINWEDKAKNIGLLADKLNVRRENILFLDDNPVECAQVKAVLPDVTVVNIPDNEQQLLQFCQLSWIFNARAKTSVDAQRSDLYRTHLQREDLREQSLTLPDFIASLNLQIVIEPLQPSCIERVAQLTERTNQFNFTGTIYSNEELQLFSTKQSVCLQVTVSDRFGDYGLVGAMIYSVHNQTLWLEAFMLSCRVLGRGVEITMLQHLHDIATQAQASQLAIAFYNTGRNEPAKRFLESLPVQNIITENTINYHLLNLSDIVALAPMPATTAITTNTATVKPQGVINRQKSAEIILMPQDLIEAMRPVTSINNSDTTNKIIAVWQEILRVSAIQPDSNYLSLGGDSLKAARIVSRLFNSTGVELSLRDIFSYPSPKLLADYMTPQQIMPAAKTEAVATNNSANLQLSFSQQWLYFLNQLLPSTWFYNMPVALRLTGNVNEPALIYALHKVLQRHAVLRTKFIENNSQPSCLLAATEDFSLQTLHHPLEKSCELQELYRSEARKPFDLANDILLRATLIKMGNDKNILLLTLHHIIFDGWSYDILYRELAFYYNNYASKADLPLPTHNFFDFAQWQNSFKTSDKYARNLKFWQQELAQVTSFDITPDFPRTRSDNHNGEYFAFELGEALASQIKLACQRTGVSQYAFLLSAYALLLAQRSKKNNIVILSPVAGREQMEYENTIGCYVNLVIVNLLVNPDMNVSAFIQQVFDKSLLCFEHQQTAFTDVLSNVLNNGLLGKDSLFQVMFSWQSMVCNLPLFNNITTEYFTHGYPAARVELILELEERGNIIAGGFYYNSSLYQENTIATLVSEIKQIVNFFVEKSSEPLAAFSLPAANISQPTLLHHLFEKNARENPHASALNYHNKSLSYGCLNAKSNQLAWFLDQQYHVQPGDKIVICIPNSFELIIAIMAAMKLGVTYIPMSANANNFNQQILLQTKPKVILANSHTQDFYHSDISQTINIDVLDLSFLRTSNINRDYSPDTIAYIIYTSGSTGTPKGVMVRHESLANLFNQTQALYNFSAQDKLILACSYTFDFSIWETWAALAFGGELVIPHFAIAENLFELFQLISDAKITVFNQTPLVLQQYLVYLQSQTQALANNLRLVILGGDTLQPTTLQKFFAFNPKCKVYNMYGITEVTIHATFQEITPEICQQTKSLIGKPLPSYELFLIDENGNVVTAPDITAEIYIGGPGLASGYFDEPVLSATRFCFPLKNQPQKRLFKSGDQARYTQEGNVEFMGRSEQQAKLRGYRVNLPGIAALLHSHPGVHSAQLQINHQGNLIAHVVPDDDTARPVLNAAKELTRHGAKIETMPNGLTLHYYNKNELNYLYQEIFVKEDYLKSGIVLEPGNCVIDVGANIGLFSIHMAYCVPDLQFYAVEPAAEVYAILSQNAQLHQLNMTCINAGLANEDTMRHFTFYEDMSIMSGLHANIDQDSAAITINLQNTASSIPVATAELRSYAHSLLKSNSRMCTMHTLSTLIAKHNIKQIDLLKIDAEKGELEILQGISNADWDKIKQLVIELHDHNNTRNIIENLLQRHGFYFRTTQENNLVGTSIFKIFATRNASMVAKTSALSFTPPYQFFNAEQLTLSLKEYVAANLPEYMVPTQINYLPAIPLNKNGKFALPTLPAAAAAKQETSVSSTIANIWQEVLGINNITLQQSFFDLGGNSLSMMSVYVKLAEAFPGKFTLVDLFRNPTIADLEQHISKKQTPAAPIIATEVVSEKSHEVAIIGMAGAFPGADDLDEFWQNLHSGVDTIHHFTPDKATPKNFVAASGLINNIDLFDAEFFTISPKEAAIMDPQHRLFLMLAYHALEIAGYTAAKFAGQIGIYAGMGNSRYLDFLNQHQPHLAEENHIQLEIGNEKDYLATRIANKLGLSGSALNINTACSTSLVAIVKACQSLNAREDDMILAGGISLLLPERAGYVHKTENILSPDGVCRPFSANSNGTVLSSGAGVVVLKRLADAKRDNDKIYAVIKGYATNNDGAKKVGFTAPSADGQAQCIAQALKVASLSPRMISYLEAHGTGTRLGDPIEIEALKSVYQQHSQDVNYCALGSVKGNIGHADAAAGMAGLLKIILMLQHQKIPPSLHFDKANPHIDFGDSPFYVNTRLKEWAPDTQGKHIAAVSSFGIGGSNAHLIVESAPILSMPHTVQPFYLLIWSAQTASALATMRDNLTEFLTSQANMINLADIAYTLQHRRQDFACRDFIICTTLNEAINYLRDNANTSVLAHNADYSSLQQLAMAWKSHQVNEFQPLASVTGQRIYLPVYPFQKQRYWYDSTCLAGVNAKNHLFAEKSLEQVANLVENCLGVANLDYYTHFYDLGGTSLQLLDLISAIEDIYELQLSLDDLAQHATIHQLHSIINGTRPLVNKAELVLLKPGKAGPIILLHPTNGALFQYQNLLEIFATDYEIYGIKNEINVSTPEVAQSISEQATYYLKLIQSISRTPVLIGWSYGGTLAFELARQLEQNGTPAKAVVMIDSWAQYDERLRDRDYYQRIFASRYEQPASDKHMVWSNNIWQRVQALMNYQPATLTCPVLLFKAGHLFDEYKQIDNTYNHWHTYAETIETITLAADHETIMQRPQVYSLLNLLQAKLQFFEINISQE